LTGKGKQGTARLAGVGRTRDFRIDWKGKTGNCKTGCRREDKELED
jgi:hypothetical protein